MSLLKLPINDEQRVENLREYEILDTAPEQIFDDIVLIAAQICKTPVALISFVDKDRQWFKSAIGIEGIYETPRECSFCSHAILQPNTFIVENAKNNPIFQENTFVQGSPYLAFYAGVPLVSSTGYSLGTLSVIDTVPRHLDEAQIKALEALGREVVYLLEARKNNLKSIREKNSAEVSFFNILEFIDQMIWSMDLNLKLTYCNKAIYTKTGYTAEEVVNDPEIFFSIILEEDQPKITVFADEIKKNKKGVCTFRIKHKKGKIFEFNATAKLIEENGVPIRIDGISYDVTEINSAQKIIIEQKNKLVLASRLEALGQISSSIGHEIKNPLGIISTSAGYLGSLCDNKEMVPAKDVLKITEKIENTAFRIAKIIRSLKTFSRDSTNDPLAEIKLKPLVQEVLDLADNRFKTDNISLIIDDIPDYISLDCRSSEIYQVIINIINNAYDAVQDLDEKWVKLTYTDLGSSFELAIIDSGKGIEKSIREKLFQPFFTTKEVNHGTGLGLSISEKIIQNHNGILRYDELSPNTKFIVRLNKSNRNISTLKSVA